MTPFLYPAKVTHGANLITCSFKNSAGTNSAVRDPSPAMDANVDRQRGVNLLQQIYSTINAK